MNIEKKILKQIGSNVAEIMGNGLTDKKRDAQEKALLSYIKQEKNYQFHIKIYGISAIAATIILLLFAYFILVKDRDRKFRIDQEKIGGNIGSIIKGDEKKPVKIAFEDGSEISLLGDTSGTVLKSNSKEVNFKLLNGKIKATIESSKKVKWLIEAGPYKIFDIGTTFYVEWNHNNNSLEISLLKGMILIKGPNLGKGKLLKGISSISIPEIDNHTRSAENLEDNTEVDNNKTKSQIIEQDIQSEEKQKDIINNECNNNVKQNSVNIRWKELFNEGRYSESVESAEKDGFNNLIGSLDQNDMWLLADACRYAKNGQRAQEVLSSIRQRFSKSNRTKIASFLLGRINIELNKNPSSAVNWFNIYLQEDPNGPLTEEALGRLIDAYIATGDRENAAKAARTYLLKYNNRGIFAPLAHSIIEQ